MVVCEPPAPARDHHFRHELKSPSMPLNPPFRSIDDSRDMAPPHPGEILREDMLPHFNVTARELARQIGVPARTLETRAR